MLSASLLLRTTCRHEKGVPRYARVFERGATLRHDDVQVSISAFVSGSIGSIHKRRRWFGRALFIRGAPTVGDMFSVLTICLSSAAKRKTTILYSTLHVSNETLQYRPLW